MDKTALTFSDINIVPCDEPCTIRSRKEIDLTTNFTRKYKLKIPIIASPMDTICDSRMAIAMYNLGGCGIIHRFMSIDDQANEVKKLIDHINPFDTNAVVAAAIGVTNDYLERAKELTNAGVNVLFLDTAHGNHIMTKEAMFELMKHISSYVDIVPGNVSHYNAAINLVNWGAAALRINIGGGSICSTRIQTGVGIPTVTSIESCVDIDIPIIMDGGIKSSGDIAKALAIGADSIITGGLLAGTDETPGDVFYDIKGGATKVYRGSASYESKKARGEKGHVEGVSTTVPYKGNVSDVVNGLIDGIKSSFSYVNAKNISEFHSKARYVQVSNAGIIEAQPHALLK